MLTTGQFVELARTQSCYAFGCAWKRNSVTASLSTPKRASWTNVSRGRSVHACVGGCKCRFISLDFNLKRVCFICEKNIIMR